MIYVLNTFPLSMRPTKSLILLITILGTSAILWVWSLSSSNPDDDLKINYSEFIDLIPLTRNWKEIESRNLTLSEISDLSPKDLQIINANISYGGYMDEGSLKDCSYYHGHRELFEIMKFWINFSSIHNIPWWLTYGSLLGAMRHNDMIPWDTDIDLEVPSQYEGLIRNLSTPRHKISASQVNIITRPDEFCLVKGRKLDCNGNEVTTYVDSCAFCEPLARLFFNIFVRVDIFLAEVKVFDKELKVIQYSTYKTVYDIPLFPYEWIFPLQSCRFMGLVLRCPRSPGRLLGTRYGNLSSNHQCIDMKWQKLTATNE